MILLEMMEWHWSFRSQANRHYDDIAGDMLVLMNREGCNCYYRSNDLTIFLETDNGPASVLRWSLDQKPVWMDRLNQPLCFCWNSICTVS